MNHSKYLSKSLWISCLTICASSLWAGPQDPTPMPELPPCVVAMASPNYCFSVSFDALILRPFANNIDYGAEALPFNYGDAQPAVSPSWQIKEISPDFHFGFNLGLATVFHDAHSNLKLNWERYHTPNDSSSFTVPNEGYMIGPFFEIGPDASTYKKSKGTTHFHFDEVNLDYGVFVNFGEDLMMNLYTGVGFSRIKQHHFARYSNLDNTVVRTIDVPSKFIGAGPQLGFDFGYKIVKGLTLAGNAMASLFVGSFYNQTNYSTDSEDLVLLGDENPNLQSTKVPKKGGIVPGFEGKLGLAYEFTFNCHYMFRIEAGYQAQIFINAIRSIDMGSEVALGDAGSVGSSTVGVYARTFQRTVSDFGVAGPYASIALGF